LSFQHVPKKLNKLIPKYLHVFRDMYSIDPTYVVTRLLHEVMDTTKFAMHQVNLENNTKFKFHENKLPTS
jgi:hypothetical protein